MLENCKWSVVNRSIQKPSKPLTSYISLQCFAQDCSKDTASTGSEVTIDWFKKNKTVVKPDKFQTITLVKQGNDHTY